MNNIPAKLRKDMAADPSYGYCMRYGWHDHTCAGRLTWEHAAIFAGKQIQLKSFILSICEHGHAVGKYQDGGDLNKEIHLWIALNRASNEELEQISKVADYRREKERLNAKYGVWEQKIPDSVWDVVERHIDLTANLD